jgi:hypothetical protein
MHCQRVCTAPRLSSGHERRAVAVEGSLFTCDDEGEAVARLLVHRSVPAGITSLGLLFKTPLVLSGSLRLGLGLARGCWFTPDSYSRVLYRILMWRTRPQVIPINHG